MSITTVLSRIGGIYTFLSVLTKAILTDRVRRNYVKAVTNKIKEFSPLSNNEIV